MNVARCDTGGIMKVGDCVKKSRALLLFQDFLQCGQVQPILFHRDPVELEAVIPEKGKSEAVRGRFNGDFAPGRPGHVDG